MNTTLIIFYVAPIIRKSRDILNRNIKIKLNGMVLLKKWNDRDFFFKNPIYKNQMVP